MNPILVTMRGPASEDFNVLRMSNFEAGILALSRLNEVMPGLTWGQLAAGIAAPVRMSGWLTDLTKAVSAPVKSAGSLVMDVGRGAGGAVMDVSRSAGDLVKNAADATGSKFGDAVRLVTDEKVMASANSAYKTYTDGGGVAGFFGYNSIFGKGGGGGTGGESDGAAGGIWDFIVNLGSQVKAKVAGTQAASASGGMPPWAVPAAVGGVVVLYLVFGGRRK
jgi:hypothetical protein